MMSYKIVLLCFFVSTHAWQHSSKTTRKTSPGAVFVSAPAEEVTPGADGAELPCPYKVCSDPMTLVSITWKVGSSPNTAKTIANCSNYDQETGKATNFKSDYMPSFTGRLKMKEGKYPPTLIIFPIEFEKDNRNVWCQVQTSAKKEFGTDLKSTVVRIKGSYNERPKFNIVSVTKNLVDGSSGNTITLECSCSGYHCDDVIWYKGPVDETENAFEKIYSKHTVYRQDPIIAYGLGWEHRISVSGYSLTIKKLAITDTGRYWCEAKGADYYSLGETGTDSKSILLVVDQPGIC